VRGLFVSGDFFSTLGVRPAVGRLFDQRDDSEGAAPRIVVSHRFWQSNLSGDGAVLGKEILIGKTMFTVVGVTAAEFAQLDPGLTCDLWIPLAFNAKGPPYTPSQTKADAIWMELIGRLKPKISLGQAASAVSTAFAASTTSDPEAIFKSDDAPQIELAPSAHGPACRCRAGVIDFLRQYRRTNIGAVSCPKKRTGHACRSGCNARQNHFATTCGKSAPRLGGRRRRNGARSFWGAYARIVLLAKLVDAAPTRRSP